MPKLKDISGLKVGDKVAIVINRSGSKNTSISGILTGISNWSEDKVALQIADLPQWIYLEDNYAVTWSSHE
jgi:ABC-type protease/lipase transport system fused ATPase/permease subunit